MSKFTLKEKELVKLLDISLEKLDDIIRFFDSDPDDEWELIQGEDYIITNKTWNNKLFSRQGAFTLAKYLDKTEHKNLLRRIKEFITKHSERVMKAFVKQTIHENCSSLVLQNNLYFLSVNDVVKILGTNHSRIYKAVDELRISDIPLMIGVDFEYIEGKLHFSMSGLDRLSRNLSTTLTKANRRAWCEGVNSVATQTFKLIVSEEAKKEQAIKNALASAKRRDKSTCQVTKQKPTKEYKFNLAVHHLYSLAEYPHLATCLDNLITVKEEIHKEFHESLGGFNQPCTLDDFLNFLNLYYPEADELQLKLNAKRYVLKSK